MESWKWVLGNVMDAADKLVMQLPPHDARQLTAPEMRALAMTWCCDAKSGRSFQPRGVWC
jgi:hypothetical protein